MVPCPQALDTNADHVCVRVREDVIEHALGHRDAELTIDRRNEPRTHGKVTLRRRDALDESGELRLIRHAVRIVVAGVEEELDMAQIADTVTDLDVFVGDARKSLAVTRQRAASRNSSIKS